MIKRFIDKLKYRQVTSYRVTTENIGSNHDAYETYGYIVLLINGYGKRKVYTTGCVDKKHPELARAKVWVKVGKMPN